MSRAHTNFPHDNAQKDPHAPAHDRGKKRSGFSLDLNFIWAIVINMIGD